jgi:hypothetical protein
MLNKHICKRCHETKNFLWDTYDEDQWDNGNVVYCMYLKDAISRVRGWYNRTGEPTEHCPFYLEHVVNEKNDEQK